MDHFYQKLCEAVPESRIRLQEPMARHTTFRAGGPADYFAEPETKKELAALLDCCRQAGMPHYILGNGSNLLVGDRGYRGVIISMGGEPWCRIRTEGTALFAGAGALLSVAARRALSASLTGMEFASGIPGTLGGAVVMNAGAYGSEMKEILKAVRVLTPAGAVETIPAEALELGYRTSCIARRGYVVLEAELSLKPGNETDIRARMEELAALRKEKQPCEYPSAGSTFKRPEGFFAGKLIQDAGLRGFQVGGAQVSEKHCGFVINRDHGTAADIMAVCTEVKRRVKEQFGVELEMEVKTLGEF